MLNEPIHTSDFTEQWRYIYRQRDRYRFCFCVLRFPSWKAMQGIVYPLK
jgi:hypothetical protein